MSAEDLTLKRQSGGQPEDLHTSLLLAALERAWARISDHHPELPRAVVIIGAGSDRKQGLFKWGHYARMRWRPVGRDESPVPEVLVAGEGLLRSPEDVMETLLHEAAHAIADARGLRDTSRDGRYHNRRYQQVATEVGLQVVAMPPYGWAETSMRQATSARYAWEMAEVADRLAMYRVAEQGLRQAGGSGGRGGEAGDGRDDEGRGGDEDTQRDRNLRPASCGCGRRIRIAPSTLTAGPITCGACGTEFAGIARMVGLISRSEGAERPQREAGR